jgi:hypothetical protein
VTMRRETALDPSRLRLADVVAALHEERVPVAAEA